MFQPITIKTYIITDVQMFMMIMPENAHLTVKGIKIMLASLLPREFMPSASVVASCITASAPDASV